MGFLSRIKSVENCLRQKSLIIKAGFFDQEWYASRYDVAGGAVNALSDFLDSNGKRDPSAEFSCYAYLKDNADVRTSGINPLLHYLRFGREEGRVYKDVRGQIRGPVEKLGDAANARLRALFDSEFYRNSNPDLEQGTDGFEHFMTIGWRQKRDPAAWFSTEAYVMDHGELGGKNPFSHYVFCGARDGKAIRRSRRICSPIPPSYPVGALRVAVVAMVKNEADIIRLFTSHLLSLFDEIVIVDHCSDDGTELVLAELAERYTQLTVLKLRDPSYIQSVTMTHVLRNELNVRRADWVFFLDVDEFLPFESRREFHNTLVKNKYCAIISFQWKNIIPFDYRLETIESARCAEFLFPPMASPFRKVALQPSRLNVEKLIVAQGNHALLHAVNGLEVEASEANFHLLHIPVRSEKQMRSKLKQGVQAYQKMGRFRDAQQGKHWAEMLDALNSEGGAEPVLNAMAVDYSEDAQAMKPIGQQELMSRGFVRGPLRIAMEPEIGAPILDDGAAAPKAKQPIKHAQTTQRRLAKLFRSENGELTRCPGSFAEYPKLPKLSELPVARRPDFESFLRASLRAIDVLLPSAWAEHVPFLFALLSMIEPRRYVELGMPQGTSFVTFAQIAATAEPHCEAIAVSPLSLGGDLDEQKAFEIFRFEASKYSSMVGFLQMDHAQAAHRFEDHSIDLLNIDAPRYGEDLGQVLRSWLPKLSTQGIVLLHGIDAMQTKPHVRQVWEGLKAQFPSLEFLHGQGLGLVCYGSDTCPPLLAMANALEQNPRMRTAFQDYFRHQGRASAKVCALQAAVNHMEQRFLVGAISSREVRNARQKLSLTQENCTAASIARINAFLEAACAK